jgi:hypothetical protein
MKYILAFIFGSVLISSCESDTSEIGSDFFTDGVLDFSFIDTATVNLSTVQLDEIVTSATTRMLAGTHDDPLLGKIIASPFMQVIPASDVNLKDENVVYDYLSLVLPLDHYSYYDTLLPLTLHVYRVTEDIETDEGYLYNSSSFQIGNEPLGSLTFKPRPHNDSIEIKLSDVLGLEIFQKALDGGDELNSTDFLKYIQGFAIVPDTSQSGCLLGLTTNPTLRLHYVDKSTTPVSEKFIAFNVENSSGLYFTNITCNRKGTLLEHLPPAEERLDAAFTDGKAYIQAGAGLALRVDIPYLRSLKQHTNFYPTYAVLDIYPVRKSADNFTKLPIQLKVYKANKKNEVYEEVEALAQLVEDVELGRDTHYSFDVTEFVKAQMELQSLNENGLIFTTDKTAYPVSVDRLYAAASGYEYRTRLRIYFATVNN